MTAFDIFLHSFAEGYGLAIGFIAGIVTVAGMLFIMFRKS
jgi:hypothetical protein